MSPMPPPLPPRYEFLRRLGAGAMGEVVLVNDTVREAQVALKRLTPGSEAAAEEGRLLFKQEYFAMASLRHPNLVAAYDLGESEDGTPFFTMEYVTGADLTGDGKLDEAAVRRLLPGLAAALGHLHGHGWVHGDLKPENIRLTEDGQVKLMDLGLLAPSGRVSGAIRGTLFYVAPEAIRQGVVDTRADLYGLGAVLFHLLTGHPPFEIGDTLGLLRAHLELTPPDVRQFAPDVSTEFAAVVRRLLAKDPAQRPATTADVLDALGLSSGTEAGAILFGSPLVGRQAIQREIQATLRASYYREAWVTGPEGAGRTRLLAEAAAEAQILGVTTFRAEGQGSEAPAYMALRPWLRALTERPSETLGRLAPALSRLLPELGVEPLPPLEGAQERSRVLAAIAELASEAAPDAVWLVDDADRLDPDSRALLDHLRRQRGATTWRWVLSAVAGEDPEAPPSLTPLSDDDTLTIAQGLLGQETLPAPVIERLPVLAAGLPGVAEAVVRHWVGTGALRRTGGRWEAAAGAESFALPGGLTVALDQTFIALPESARLVGRTAAILGAAGELAALRSLTPLDDAGFYEGLSRLTANGIVRQEGGRFRFAQPARAAALAASWTDTERKRLHREAALWFEARLAQTPDGTERPLDLVIAVAHHHLAGDTPVSALPFVNEAASRAIALHAVAAAEPLLVRTLELELTPGDRLSLQAYLALIWRLLAKNDQALGLYESEILPHGRSTHSATLAHDLVSYGLLVQMKGRYDDAMAAFSEALALADASRDTWGSIRARISAARVAIFLGRRAEMLTLLEESMTRSREAGLENHYARTLVLYGYALASADRDRMDEGLAHLHEGIAILLRINNLAELLDAYNNLGNLHLHAGRFAAALEAFTAYAELCDRLGQRTEAVFAQLNLGAVRLELGELTEARAHASRGVAMARETKRRFPEGFGLAIEGLVQVFEGHGADGLDAIATALTIARELKNKYLELNQLPYEAEARIHLGDWDGATRALEAARALAAETGNAELDARLTRLEAAIAVGTGHESAAERLEALDRAALEAPGESAHAERWRGEWHYRAGRGVEAEAAFARALARAEADGLALVAVEASYRLGQLAQESGVPERARALYEIAFNRARQTGYVLYELLSALAIGKLDPRRVDLREEPRRRLRAMWEGLSPEAQAGFMSWPERRAVLAAEPSVSGRQGRLVERMIEVVATPDPDGVMQRAVEAFVELTGVERGFLLLFEGFEVTRMATAGHGDDEPDEYSTSLAYRVLWSGEPLWLEDVSADQELAGQASVLALGLRSAVGVPVLHDGRPIGVLMGDSKGLIPDFGAAELDLAMAFAQFVGEAITGAERTQRFRQGYEEHRVLHRVAMVGLKERSLEGFLAVVAREVLALTQAERMVFLSGAALTPVVAFTGPEASPSSRLEVSSSVASWVAEHQEPLFLIDAQTDESFQARHSVQALGLRTVMAVPAGRGDAWKGVIYVDTQRVGRQDDRMLHTLAQIGEMVGAFLSRES